MWRSSEAGWVGIVETAIEKEHLKDGRDVTVALDEVRNDAVKKDTVLSSAEDAIKAVLTEKKITVNVITKEEPDRTANSDIPSPGPSDTSSETQPAATSSEPSETSEDPSGESTGPIFEDCRSCYGSGECLRCNGGKNDCPACGGTGYQICPQCDENGLDGGFKCFACGGTGKQQKEE